MTHQCGNLWRGMGNWKIKNTKLTMFRVCAGRPRRSLREVARGEEDEQRRTATVTIDAPGPVRRKPDGQAGPGQGQERGTRPFSPPRGIQGCFRALLY